MSFPKYIFDRAWLLQIIMCLIEITSEEANGSSNQKKHRTRAMIKRLRDFPLISDVVLQLR